MIDIPDIREALGTRFSLGNNTVWCTVAPRIKWVTVPIRVIDERVPAVTERILMRPSEQNRTQHLDPAPVQEFVVPLTQGYIQEIVPPQYSVGQEHYTQREFYFQDRVTPTVTYIRDFVPEVYPHVVDFPVPPTKTARYYPAPFFVAQHVTPTTYQTERALLPHENFTIAIELPVTRKWMFTAKPERYMERIYPTRVDYQYITPPDFEYEDYVPLPYTKKIDYQVEYEQFNEQVAATQINWEIFAVPRERYQFTLAPWPTVKYFQNPYKCNNYGPWIRIDVEHITIDEIVTRSGGCAVLDGLECRTAETHEDFRAVGQVVTCDSHYGFMCRHSDQRNICNQTISNQTITNMCACYSYEVRIRCCGNVYHLFIPRGTTKRIDLVPPVRTVWEHRPVTTAKLYVKQPRVQAFHDEVEVVTQMMKQTPSYEFERIFKLKLRPTTVDTAIIIPEIKRKLEYEVIPLPVTRKMYYPPGRLHTGQNVVEIFIQGLPSPGTVDAACPRVIPISK
ncbi:hypothetical protein AVEN_175439-1 [Araneus ventricosus]|uniref:WxxW domain-containing protein n=1 Tax=Araneus ventricosus TaxID=182803 RepID=A0A4Y2PRB5_ARAVE|nr:hypothetical protein AVEN_175439-1 [Araneus ventricosus]